MWTTITKSPSKKKKKNPLASKKTGKLKKKKKRIIDLLMFGWLSRHGVWKSEAKRKNKYGGLNAKRGEGPCTKA